MPKSASEPGVQRSLRVRSQASEASTCWLCARGIAEPETFWTRSRRQQPKKEDVFKALGQMANRFQTRAGESLPSVEKEPSLPAEVTTPSLEAWRSYSAAMKASQRKAQSAEVISLLKRAIEIDPKFAMAYAYLGRQYAALGEPELGAQNIAKAYQLRDRS